MVAEISPSPDNSIGTGSRPSEGIGHGLMSIPLLLFYDLAIFVSFTNLCTNLSISSSFCSLSLLLPYVSHHYPPSSLQQIQGYEQGFYHGEGGSELTFFRPERIHRLHNY